jgi:thymidylate synthase
LKQYLELLEHVLTNGKVRGDRTGTGTISVFGYQNRYDLSKGFPLPTTKEIYIDGIVSELLWFLRGDTNIQYLLKNKNNTWNEWAIKKWFESSAYTGVDMTDFGRRVLKDPEFKKIYQEQVKLFKNLILIDDAFAKEFGDLGPVYGEQWRSWKGANGKIYDQIAWVINEIKRDPNSRRLIVNAWAVDKIMDMQLPPCHVVFQFYVEDGKLSCMLTQRSGDAFLGVAFNIASYALLTHMVAAVTGLEVGEFIHSFGDLHIYLNHVDQVKLQLSREPRELPKLHLVVPESLNINDFKIEDITFSGYNPQDKIKAPIAV